MKIPIAVIILGASTLHAQTNAYQLSNLAGTETRLVAVEPLAGQIVTGHPFSATEERHSLQVLGDGTRIEISSSNKLYRDDQGRTRTERPDGTVTITDPVAGFTAQLDTNSRTFNKLNGPIAMKLPSLRFSETDDMHGAKLMTVQSGLALGNDFSVTLDASKAETAQLQKQMDEQKLTDERRGGGGGGVAFSTATRPAIAYATATPPGGAGTTQAEPAPNVALENLPLQSVNGVMATGTRRTEVVPFGKIGNDRPLSITSERWVSGDLKMLIKSSSSDPRFGETTYQLTNVVQSAPSSSLFQIPADYTAKARSFKFTTSSDR